MVWDVVPEVLYNVYVGTLCVHITIQLDKQHLCIPSDVKSQVRPEFDNKTVSMFQMEHDGIWVGDYPDDIHHHVPAIIYYASCSVFFRMIFFLHSRHFTSFHSQKRYFGVNSNPPSQHGTFQEALEDFSKLSLTIHSCYVSLSSSGVGKSHSNLREKIVWLWGDYKVAARFQKREAGLSWLRVLKKSSNKNACECAVHRHPGKGIYIPKLYLIIQE